ncbi:MAG: helix-turn-helix domain-containing protein [Magnetospirillum sp.]|nr:helix-turn-helix domain-containing protein [Magnetospirillum sp.]
MDRHRRGGGRHPCPIPPGRPDPRQDRRAGQAGGLAGAIDECRSPAIAVARRPRPSGPGHRGFPPSAHDRGHAPPPSLDFEAVDLLHDCFPRGTRQSANRVLLAVARNLTRNFGQPGRLPMASGKAWTMLDPAVFADQMAAQLAEINAFILKWQSEEKSFLILEFAEVELIEYMFEHLHPRRHGALLVRVMDFKVLSARRVGLLRRIPARVRRVVQHLTGADPAAPLTYARDCIVMLEAIERAGGFHLVTEAAAFARGEIEKIVERLVQQTPPPPAATALPPPGLPAVPLAEPSARPPAPPAVAAAPANPLAIPPQPISSMPLPLVPAQIVGVSGTPAPLPRMTPPPAPPRKRFTNKDKIAAVMRVFQGEDRDWVAISLGIDPEMLARWQDSFLDGGVAALAPKPKAVKKPSKAKPAMEEASIDDLKAKLQSLLQTVEVLSTQIQAVPAMAALPPPAPCAPCAPSTPPPGFPPELTDPPPRPKRTRKPPRR